MIKRKLLFSEEHIFKNIWVLITCQYMKSGKLCDICKIQVWNFYYKQQVSKARITANSLVAGVARFLVLMEWQVSWFMVFNFGGLKPNDFSGMGLFLFWFCFGQIAMIPLFRWKTAKITLRFFRVSCCRRSWSAPQALRFFPLISILSEGLGV